MSSNYQQKKMMNALGAIDTKGNIVLEQFQDGTALLFQPGNAEPFCVATDYDRATASWSYGKYFSDLGCAHEAADPEIIEDASVRWVKEDIREKLKAQDIAPTEFNVQSVIMGDSRLSCFQRVASKCGSFTLDFSISLSPMTPCSWSMLICAICSGAAMRGRSSISGASLIIDFNASKQYCWH